MKNIVAVHSFRRGAGKSNLVANLAVLLARQGKRVAVVDTAFQSPGMSQFLGLRDGEIAYTLNDYLWGKCEIGQPVYDVTAGLGLPEPGCLYLIPASARVPDIMQMLRAPFDFDRFCLGLDALPGKLGLDILLVDTSAGLSEVTLPAIAISDTLIVVLQPRQTEYQGTAVTVEVAHNLQVPRLMLVLNGAPDNLDLAQSQAELEEKYGCPVGAILPHSDEMLILGSTSAFVLVYPHHSMSHALEQLAERLVSGGL